MSRFEFQLKKQSVFEKIEKYEQDMGECFVDRFDHYVNHISYAFFLIGKGYLKHGNDIINEETVKGHDVNYEHFCEIKDEYSEKLSNEKRNSNYDFNRMMLSEFLISTPIYEERFNDFIHELNNEG